jgi:hypothetical protein
VEGTSAAKALASELEALRVDRVGFRIPVTIRRERIGQQVGHLDDKDIARFNIALAFVMGLAD